MVDTAIEERRAQADATTQLREVIRDILAADEPAGQLARLGPALAKTNEGWRDVRRLLVAPWMREAKLAP
ncbi:MAG TPA: Vi polysaccharide transport protein VexE, partial [Achromobacter sp.]|nr:Vi polysaccharide transport protein VexE [Achromobacter sp.]